MRRGFDEGAADRALRRADPDLGRWMRRITLPPGDYLRPFNPVDALARAIMHQQLSGKAAAAITGRIERLMLRRGYITAAGIDAASDEDLRAAGVSRQKLRALRDLAAKADAGIVPEARRLARIDNAAVIERLVQVRGIGRWTVEMLLMFRLGRPDILPLDDLGIRKGMRVLRNLEALPTPRHLAALGEVWAPWRTRASLYLWRIGEMESADPGLRRPRPTARPDTP